MLEAAHHNTPQPVATPLIAADCFPVPLPNAPVEKVRDWITRVLPLEACRTFLYSVTEVRYECGRDTPEWLRKIAREIATKPLYPEMVQMACYLAMSQYVFTRWCERVFNYRLTDDHIVKGPLRFQKYLSEFFSHRLEDHALKTVEFRENPAAGWASLKQVYFDVSCDPLLFPNEPDRDPPPADVY